MAGRRADAVRAVMPADGTDLVDVFAQAGGIGSGDLVAQDATVRFVAPSAENVREGPEGFFEGWMRAARPR